MGWQWHQLDHMQIIWTSLQTDNHTSTSPLNFYRPDALPTVAKNWRHKISWIKSSNPWMWRLLILKRICVFSHHVRMLCKDGLDRRSTELAKNMKRSQLVAACRELDQNLVKLLWRPASHWVGHELLQRVPVVITCKADFVFQWRERLKAKNANGNLWLHYLSKATGAIHRVKWRHGNLWSHYNLSVVRQHGILCKVKCWRSVV